MTFNSWLGCQQQNYIIWIESNDTVDVAMWPKYDKSSISKKEVIIMSIL